MRDERAAAAMAYLDEAQPVDGGWEFSAARDWLETSTSREAKALRAALDALDIR